MKWIELKSGSDVRGTAVGEGTVLTEEVAAALGAAFVAKLAEEKGKPAQEITVALGRDSRITGPALQQAAANGIARAGAQAVVYGMCTTPAMYMSTITPGFEPDGAIMVTASHHPWNKNGLKFFTSQGGLEGSEIGLLLEKAESLDLSAMPGNGSVIEQAFLPVYMNQLADRIRRGLQTREENPLDGLHVVVDAGNGAGGFYATMLEKLGANTEGSQFLNPDGYFPNHIPNPENADAMRSLCDAVIRAKADLGVIFDADCDRAAIVDGSGKGINRNRLIALISAILLENGKKETIVTDSVTSSGLRDFIVRRGGEHYRFKRGYRNVIDEAIRLNGEGVSCPLAIETSGHAALKENHFLDDGMYLVTVLIVKAMQLKKEGKGLGEMIADLKEPVESREIRVAIQAADFHSVGQEVIQRVMDTAKKNPEWHIAPDNREGVRISFDLDGKEDAGWFLLRLSVHDPVLPLNVESDVTGGVQIMLRKLYGVIGEMQGIDLSGIREALEQET